jgi:GH15 family glucan-1,4-alpha-glucosidase
VQGFPGISDYGLIGDGRTAALVSRFGSIEWCCLPHFHSPSIFAAILDRERGGFFSICPVGEFSSEQHYVEDTNILQTTFQTASGTVRVTDLFSVTSEEQKRKELWPDHEILRIVEGVRGQVSMLARYAPRPNYGEKVRRLERRGNMGIACACGEKSVLLRTTLPMSEIHLENGEAAVQFTICAGQAIHFSVVYAEDAPAVIPPLGASADTRMSQSTRYWTQWLSQCNYDGPYYAHVRRSALALKLLSFAPSGALVAAPTASLPEYIGGIRNWDYRYCWPRDASATIRTMVSLGFHAEADAFLSWILHTTRLTRPRLQVLYKVYGHPGLHERIVDSLHGYRNSKPVRIGNGAAKQFQLDVYGEVLDGIHSFLSFVNEFDGETREFILDLGKAICELWDQPDEGIWEVRSGRAHHTHSKVLAWVGLDRLAAMAKKYSWKAPAVEYESTKNKIKDTIERRGFNADLGAYTRTLDGHELDASVLVMPLLGYCEASSARMMSTCRAICENLSSNGLIYRYRSVDDGLIGPEGSFGICNFWMAEVFAQAGRLGQAKHYFEQILKHESSVGLWSEEIDPATGEYLGNYPQAFTHIGLINAAIAISRASEGVKAA